jgi:tRNA (guanine-N7-)-methyltransferase
LNLYKQILRPGGFIHLKTDDQKLFEYTLETVKTENGKIHEAKEDLYQSPIDEDLLIIKTTYERKHLEAGKSIKYVRFGIN